MNPSAKGWINKHLPYFLEHTLATVGYGDSAYSHFRSLGFIYGTSIGVSNIQENIALQLTDEEVTKVNLLDALVSVYFECIENGTEADAVLAIVDFYASMAKKNSSLFQIPKIAKRNTYYNLETILHQRVQTNSSFLQKNFSHFLTNALLYIDVLVFEHYLIDSDKPLAYAEALEITVINTVCLALEQKEQKQDYDRLLLKLFQTSARYSSFIDEEPLLIEDLNLHRFNDTLERRYILDLACLAIWDDNTADDTEIAFIRDLGLALSIDEAMIDESLVFMHHFIESHKAKIALFQYTNPVKQFYKQTNKTVQVLIVRNKRRLLQELEESKELLQLLRQSTYRELTKSERQKVKTQLLDICKTIPSLAIFILPGGGVMLPLLVKFIPKLLPSAFNENLN